MSKPAINASAEFHKCPKHPDSPEIRVKGFAFCPFCGDGINADGDHNVVLLRPESRPEPKPEPPKPEPVKAESPKPAAEPAPRVPTNEELEARINAAFPKPNQTTSVPPTVAPQPPRAETIPPRPPRPRGSILPFVIFAAVIGGGGYAAWNEMQKTPAPPLTSLPPAVEEAIASPPAPERDMTDIGNKPNPNITSAGKTLTPRDVAPGLVREIKYDTANVRALPTTNSKILAQLQSGERIRPTGRITDLRGAEEGEWYRVDQPASGYVRFGNTKAPGATAPKAAAPKPSPNVPVSPVEPGLQVRAKITLLIRTTPSRVDNANDTGGRLRQGRTFSPQGITEDIGKDPGKRWYKVDGGFVAEWETEALTRASASPRDPSASPEPTPRSIVDNVVPEIDAGDRTSSTTTRGLDAIRRPRDSAPN